MTKTEFLAALRSGLSGLPEEDIEKSIEYYSEMIDDRMEEGLGEQEAVGAVGSVEALIESALAENLPGGGEQGPAEAPKKRAMNAWVIVLLVLGSPIWLALLLAAAAITAAIYIVIWLAVIVLYAATLSLAAGAIGGLLCFGIELADGGIAQSLTLGGAGLVSAGLAILMFHLSSFAARGATAAGKGAVRGIKQGFARREI